MMSRWHALSIRTKVSLTIVAVSLMGAFSIAFYFPPRMERLVRAALETKAVGVAEVLAYNLVASLEFEDVRGLEETLASATHDPGITGVQVIDAHGRTVAGRELCRDHARPVGETRVNQHGDHLEVVAPIGPRDRLLGTLVLHVDTVGMKFEVERNRMATMVVSALVGLLGLAAGTAIGYGLAVLMRPFFSDALAEAVAGGALYAVLIDWPTMIALYAALVGFYVLALLLSSLALMRAGIHRVMRLGDE